jgi:hypothetical protein
MRSNDWTRPRKRLSLTERGILAADETVPEGYAMDNELRVA